MLHLLEKTIEYNTSVIVCSNGHAKITRYVKPKKDYRIIKEKSQKDIILKAKSIELTNLTNELNEYISSNQYVDEKFLELNEKCETLKNKEVKVQSDKERAENRKKSALRSFKNIKLLAENNYKAFCSFITLTFDANQTKYKNEYDSKDINSCNDKLNSYLTYLRQNVSDLKYIAVPEYQKNGNIHYHILTNIPVNSEMIPKRNNRVIKSEGKIRTMSYYDLLGWNVGYSSAEPITSTAKALRYITKYINKETADKELPLNSRRYYASQNLDKPIIYDLMLFETEYFPFASIFNENTKQYFTYNKEWQIIFYNLFFKEEEVQDLNNEILNNEEFKKYLVRKRRLK